ncbi:MAG TPA: T9SS type A sorting domain-containing protein [Candidatus Cloacimonas sp.]|nr:T9SS type A sorting domain-containing protein [Candidatus Cloacimonas sp.]
MNCMVLNYTPFTEPGIAKLVITRSLRKPLIANIEIIPNVGPYVTAGPLELNDGNNNIAEAGDNINISLQFNNIGIDAATNLTAALSCDSPYILLNNAYISLPDIASGSSINQTNAFNISILPDVPDQHPAVMTITVSNGEESWVTQRNLTINAPNVLFGNHTLFDSDSDGIYEPGETVTISLSISNSGHMNVDGGSLAIILNSSYATLDNYNFIIPPLPAGNGIPIILHLFISQNCPDDEVIPLGFAMNAGIQLLNHSIMIPVGIVGESFESGDFSAFPWVNNSTNPWTIVSGTSNAHFGNYAAKSGTIGNYGNTTLQIAMDISSAGNISFWRKVSSESNGDYLKFYINNNETGSWSGEIGWSEVSYPVTPGSYTFKWTYSKDISIASGGDCAWLDDIRFPGIGILETAIFYTTTTQIDFTDVLPNTTVSIDFALRNLGNIAMQGTIACPAEFELSQYGNALPANYNYQIEAGQTVIYSLNYIAGNSVNEIHTNMQITTNDPLHPIVTIPVNLSPLANDDNVNIPYVTALQKNYPNPFNPETTIHYSLREAGPVKIEVYNIKGQLVRYLVNELKNAGNYTVIWNGKDEQGKNVSSGIYFYRMQTKNYSATQKMMLMK